MKRREYGIYNLENRRRITKVIIDTHYEKKHSATVDDQIILKLVETLDGEVIEPDAEDPPYSYFSQDRIELDGKGIVVPMEPPFLSGTKILSRGFNCLTFKLPTKPLQF